MIAWINRAATKFYASIRLRRLRTIFPSADSFKSNVDHKPKQITDALLRRIQMRLPTAFMKEQPVRRTE
jgi:hypothetical protein